MSSFLLTEIALDLLGNKFYTPDGQHVRNLKTLYKLSTTEPPTGEPTLQTLLCISETSLKAADNLQSDVIVLDDEEDKSVTGTTQELDATVPSSSKVPSRATKRKAKKRKARTENRPTSQESYEKPLADSSSKSSDRKFDLKTVMKLHGGDVNQRLSYIVKACTNEYEQMKEESNIEKQKFLQIHGVPPTEENIQAYYKQEKESLLKENKILMDFLKIIRNDPTCSKDGLTPIESDILKAKDLIFKTQL